MGREKEPEIIHENLRKIEIIEEFFTISSECRESYYFLMSLKNLVETHIVLSECYDEKRIKELLDRVEQAENTFVDLEQVAASSDTSSVEDNVVPFHLGINVEITDVLEVIIKTIDLRSKIDRLQVEILDYLFEIDMKFIDKLVETKPYLSELSTQNTLDLLILSAFNHSPDKDKVVTYKFYTKNRKILDDIKKNKSSLLQPIKIRDYSYVLDAAREKYKRSHQMVCNLLHTIPKIESEMEYKELSRKQAKMNKHITVLTYIVVLLTLVTVVTSIITTYHTINNTKDIHVEEIESNTPEDGN